jgi:hypothetical protein
MDQPKRALFDPISTKATADDVIVFLIDFVYLVAGINANSE